MGSDKVKRSDEKMTKKRPVERQKMRPWLMDMLKQGATQGLEWFDETQKLFKINWKHGSRHGFNTMKDASLFEKYAQHTGRWDPDDPSPKRWKANFRCALNSLQNVMEIKKLGESKGVHAFRVYQFLEEDDTKPKEGNARKSNKHKSNQKSTRKVNAKFVEREREESDKEDCPLDDHEREIPTSTSGEGEEVSENPPQCTKPEIRVFTFPTHMAGCVVRMAPRKRLAPYELEEEDKEDQVEMTSQETIQHIQYTTKRRRRDTDDESMMSYTQPSITTDESSNDSNSSVSSSSVEEEIPNTPYFSSLLTNILDDDWTVEKEETVTTTQQYV